MTLLFRSFSAALLCLVSVLVGWTSVPTEGFSQSSAKGPSAKLPPNYRQLMARYVLAHNKYVMLDAKISKPFEVWGGLIRGGSYQAVCIVTFRTNLFGTIVGDRWVLTIENGQLGPLAAGAEGCRDLSPFAELKATIVKRQ